MDCTAVFNAGVITITGSNRSDNVLIQDRGNFHPAFKVTVSCDGVQKLQVDGPSVSGITFNMGRGNDTVTYDLLGSLFYGGPATERAISGELGSGNDGFTANLGGHLKDAEMSVNVTGGLGRDTLDLQVRNEVSGLSFGGSKLNCTYDGGPGKDRLTVNATPFPDPDSTVLNIGYSSAMTLNLLGGPGADTISAVFIGDLDGALNLTADGGMSKDAIDAVFTLEQGSGFGVSEAGVLPYRDLPAALAARVLGKQGKDSLKLVVNKQTPRNFSVGALIDGGTQADSYDTAGSNVLVNVLN